MDMHNAAMKDMTDMYLATKLLAAALRDKVYNNYVTGFAETRHICTQK